MEPQITILPLQIEQLPAVAEVHLAAFPHSALTLLGKETVLRYYKWLLTGPHEVTALGATLEEKLVGFCFGGRFKGAVSGFVRTNKGFLFGQVITHSWFLANPVFRGRLREGLKVSFFKRFFRSGSPASAPQAAPPLPSFGILSIAVHPHTQGKGVGKLLLQEAEASARQHGYSKMHLTVECDNFQAIGFYANQGWEKISLNGMWGGKMAKNLALDRESV